MNTWRKKYMDEYMEKTKTKVAKCFNVNTPLDAKIDDGRM